ncbi:hypothetical protein MRX96_048545 [Rhipicephalus microplus]
MGRSKFILITFIGTTILPSSIVFNCGAYRCHPFRPKAEACINCWTSGHRADIRIKPKSTLSYRCGQTNERVEPPTCDPSCILCKEDPVTGSHLSVWTETILADVRTATSTLPAAPHSTTADSRLLHLWEAIQRSTADGRPRNIIAACASFLARLALDMEEHCSSLLQQQWGQTCDCMAGNLGLCDTWSLLRVLLDSTHTKAPQRKDHLRSPQQWEAALSSIRPGLQLRLVTWAEDVAARRCLDAITGSLKAAHNAAF